MKKALLTLLVVLLTVTAVFAAKKDFDYGVDIRGIYKTTATDDRVQELNLSFLPFISSDNYKFQFRFNWDVLEGFRPIKDVNTKNIFEIGNSVAKFFDNISVKIGKDFEMGMDRSAVDDRPWAYAIAEKNNFSFDLEVSEKRATGIYDYEIPAFLDIETTSKRANFPVKFEFGGTGSLLFKNQKNFKVELSPFAFITIPLTINSHEYDFTFGVITDREEKLSKNVYSLDKKLFEDWIMQASVESTFKKLTLDAWASLTKESSATSSFAIGGDAEYNFKNGYISAGFSLPFATTGNWAYMREGDFTQDLYYASFSVGDWCFIGADLEVVGLAKAVGDDIAISKFVEPKSQYVEVTGYVGFDTKPFDLRIDANFTDFKKINAELSVIFNIHSENLFQNK